jgi:hypothetical protein
LNQPHDPSLPRAAADSMHDAGYAIFSSDELLHRVAGARAAISDLIRGMFNIEMPLAEAFRAIFETDVDAYLTLVRVLSRLREVRQLIHGDDFTRFLRGELGFRCPMEPSDPVVHIQGDHLRIPGGYFGYGAHQDATAFGSDVPNLLTAWIPICDVARDAFPLEIAVGRHREGVFATVPARQVYEIPGDVLEASAYAQVPIKRGSALLFGGFTPHRSGPGHAGAFRLAFSYRLAEACDRPFFERRYQYADPGAKKT